MEKGRGLARVEIESSSTPIRMRRPSLEREAGHGMGIATGHQASLSPNAPHTSSRTSPILDLRGAISLKRSYSPFGRVDCRPSRLVPTIHLPFPKVFLPLLSPPLNACTMLFSMPQHTNFEGSCAEMCGHSSWRKNIAQTEWMLSGVH